MEERSKVHVYWFIVYLVHAVGSPGGVDLRGMQRLSDAVSLLSLSISISICISLSISISALVTFSSTPIGFSQI